MYAAVGNTRMLDERARRAQWERAVTTQARRGLRRRARHQTRRRTAEPLRDRSRQHRRSGPEADRRRRRRQRRPAARHLPYEHRGERHPRRHPARRGPHRRVPRLRQRSRDAGRGPSALARIASALGDVGFRVRSSSRPSPPRSRRSRRPSRSGGRSRRARTRSRPTVCETCGWRSGDRAGFVVWKREETQIGGQDDRKILRRPAFVPLAFWAGRADSDDCRKVTLDAEHRSAPIGSQPNLRKSWRGRGLYQPGFRAGEGLVL